MLGFIFTEYLYNVYSLHVQCTLWCNVILQYTLLYIKKYFKTALRLKSNF